MQISWDVVVNFGVELLIATGILSTIFGTIRKLWIWFKNDRAKAQIHRVLIRKYSLYDMMQEVLSYVEGNRILLLRLENGGNIPSVTKPLHTTCVEESYNPPLKSIKQDWQGRLLDIDYIKRIIELGKESVIIKTCDVKDNTLLKNLYVSSGVKTSILYYISTTEKHLFYIAIHFVEDKRINPAEEERINSLVNSIREII